eukprot:507760-Rhodomonas_salina.1
MREGELTVGKATLFRRTHPPQGRVRPGYLANSHDGESGIDRDRMSFQVRDIHDTCTHCMQATQHGYPDVLCSDLLKRRDQSMDSETTHVGKKFEDHFGRYLASKSSRAETNAYKQHS